MKLAFFINGIDNESPNYTTTALAYEAVHLGHQVWYIAGGDFIHEPDNRIGAHALVAKKHDSHEEFLAYLQSEEARRERITVDDLDVLMLRSDPSIEIEERPWAATDGIIFGQAAKQRGVLVLNDPDGLSKARNKLYFQQYPQEVRPKTLVTRCRSDIIEFVKECGGDAILKPLEGSGGRNVFLVRKGEAPNLNQMVDAIKRDGYVIAQEYLPAAEKGDMRIFLINGKPLMHKGKFAAFCRTPSKDDIRSNMHAGGKAEKANVEEQALQIAHVVRPKLIQDGMHLVGLDIAGDKLLEINVFSPGGLRSCEKLTKINFAKLVIEDVERKIDYRRLYGRAFDNSQLAVL